MSWTNFSFLGSRASDSSEMPIIGNDTFEHSRTADLPRTSRFQKIKDWAKDHERGLTAVISILAGALIVPLGVLLIASGPVAPAVIGVFCVAVGLATIITFATKYFDSVDLQNYNLAKRLAKEAEDCAK